MRLSRRGFIGGAAALAASRVVAPLTMGAGAKPDSKFHGVQIGAITGDTVGSVYEDRGGHDSAGL